VDWPEWVLAAIGAALLWIGASVLKLVASLLGQELYELCRPFAEWLVRRAARLLPPQCQDQYRDDWLAELNEVHGNLRAVGTAAGLRIWAPFLRRQLLGTAPPHPRIVMGYSALITLAGLGLSASRAVSDRVEVAVFSDRRLWLLWALGLLLECRTVRVLNPLGGITHGSGCLFYLALLLYAPAGISVPAIPVAVLLAHLISQRHQRPALGKALFNAGQFALAASAAVLTLNEMGAAQAVGSQQTVPLIGAMVAYAMVNTTLTRIAVALDRHSANVPALWSGWALDVGEWALLASLAPFSLLAADSNLGVALLVPISFGYSLAMTYLDELVRPQMDLPE